MTERTTHDAIGTLVEVCQLLSADTARIEDVAASLGSTLSADSSSVQVQPVLSAFRTARVVRASGKGDVAHVELDVTQPLTVRQLEDTFGQYRTLPRVHPNTPSKIIFFVDRPGSSHTCAVIADVDPGDRGVANGQVASVTVRRDIRLS